MRSNVLSRMVGALALVLALVVLAACGGGSAPSTGGAGGGTSATSGTTGGGNTSGPATLADIPSYPEAKALKPGKYRAQFVAKANGLSSKPAVLRFRVVR